MFRRKKINKVEGERERERERDRFLNCGRLLHNAIIEKKHCFKRKALKTSPE